MPRGSARSRSTTWAAGSARATPTTTRRRPSTTYLDAITGAARELLPAGARVLVEPGRALVARSAATIYRVVTHKRTGRDFVAVDGGMADNLEVALFGQRFEVAHAARPLGPDAIVCDLVGRQCESGDRLIQDALLPDPAVGDLLAVPVTGAYCSRWRTTTTARCGCRWCSPATAEHRAVVRRETHPDLMARDLA